MSTVDLNSDLGEGFGRWAMGDDDALLQVVTSANVACGYHASDASIMRLLCARATAPGHPLLAGHDCGCGFPDRC